MQRKTLTALIIGAALLSGCSHARNTFYGPQRPIQANTIGGKESCNGSAESARVNLEGMFRANACASLANPNDAALARSMYESGFRLVDARCNDFFAQKAGTQLGINTALDSIAPIVALLTGILSITDFSDTDKRQDYEALLAFGSVAAVSGLKAYETNFLFAAENTESVRKLTVDTLNQHANTVRNLAAGSHTFYTSTQYVVENQMICTPGRMRDLVKTAIANQKFSFVVRDVQALAGQAAGGAGIAPAAVATPGPAKAGAVLDQAPNN